MATLSRPANLLRFLAVLIVLSAGLAVVVALAHAAAVFIGLRAWRARSVPGSIQPTGA